MNKIRLFSYLLVLLAFGQILNIRAMAGVNLQQYALPGASIRAKLNAIFASTTDPNAVAQDPTWKGFFSAHWLVGKLTTLGGQTQFVVKTAKYPAGQPITLVPGMPMVQTHTPQQNLSRIKRSAEVQRVIDEKNLDKIRPVKTWVYPISGNDADLNKPTLTDHEVVVVEEMVNKLSDGVINISQNPNIKIEAQTDTLNLDRATYDQLVQVAQEARIPDLSPNNFFIDTEKKVVLIDLEDILANNRKEISESNFIVRPIKRYKLGCDEEASVAFGLAGTALYNNDDNIKQDFIKLTQQVFIAGVFKRNAFEIATVGGVVTALAIRHAYYAIKVNSTIKNCRAELKKLVDTQRPSLAMEHDCVAIAKQVVKKIVPKETREDIFKAFATIVLAEHDKTLGKIKVFDTEYSSAEDAIKKSVAFINTTWRSDWSLRSKIARGIKAVGRKVYNLFNTKETQPTSNIVTA